MEKQGATLVDIEENIDADDLIKKHKHRGKNEDDHKHTDHGAPCEEHAHRADDVDL